LASQEGLCSMEMFSYTVLSASVCVAATARCDRGRWYLTLSWLALQFLESYPLFEGRDSSVGIATTLRAGRSGDRVPVGTRFSVPVQTGPGAHPASYTMDTGSFPGVKRPGSGVDHPLHLAPRLKREYNYTFVPPLGLRGLFEGELYLYLYLYFPLFRTCEGNR